jgi:hypothetical protein
VSYLRTPSVRSHDAHGTRGLIGPSGIAVPALRSGTVILEGGRIYTGDPALPTMQALAIDDRGRVSRGVEAWEGDTSAVSTERIDLAGRVVVPGFRLPLLSVADPNGSPPDAEHLATTQRTLRGYGVTGLLDTSPGAATTTAWQRLDVDERAMLRIALAISPADDDRAPVPGFGSGHVRFGPRLVAGRAPASQDGADPIVLHASDAAQLAAYAPTLRERSGPTAVVIDASWTIDAATWAALDAAAAIPVITLDTTAAAAPSALADCVRDERAVTLATDAPPLRTLGAVRRWTELRPAAALAAVTSHAARVMAFGERDGMLKPGYPADLAILDADPLVVAPAAVDGIRVVATMVAGRWVHGRPPW